LGKEVSSKQALTAAEDIVADIGDFGDSVSAEVRFHTGGRRKNAYVFIELEPTKWRPVAEWLCDSKGVDHCSMITGIHWPDKPEAEWQVVVHLMRTGVFDPGFAVKVENDDLGSKNPRIKNQHVSETKVDVGSLSGNRIPIELEISMKLPSTREPKVPSVADIWIGADWNEKETWDLVGIDFEGHVGMRRVLLPHDSPTGYHPLQKQHKLRYHDFNEMYDDPQGFTRKPDDIGRVK
tara:strand:+ start:380 stop:1087 length:708 start_codon:yes stop_codon:yes gene_type:complete